MIPEWSEDVVRAVSAFVRTELQAPVARLSGMIDILAEDAEPRRVFRRLRLLRGWSHGNQENSEELLA